MSASSYEVDAVTFEGTVEATGHAMEGLGVLILVVATVLALGTFAADLVRRADSETAYRALRRRLGRGILVGLEVLVAADIVRTVAVAPTFRSVGVLAVIVAIRTFLSAAIQVDIDGSWPWRREKGPEAIP